MSHRICNDCTEKYCLCERIESYYNGKQKEIDRIKFIKNLEASFNPEVSY